MKHFFICLFASVLLFTQQKCCAQIVGTYPEIFYQEAYGGTLDDLYRDMITTSDGGYILFGSSNSVDGDATANFGYKDYWVVKLDSLASIQWQAHYGGPYTEQAESVVETSDGGYLLCGSTRSYNGQVGGNYGDPDVVDEYDLTYDAWVVKIHSDGSIAWEQHYGGSNDDGVLSVKELLGGDFLLCGYSYSFDHDIPAHFGNEDAWILRIDSLGGVVWSEVYGGSEYDIFGEILLLDNGNYMISGETDSNDGDVSGNHGMEDAWIVEISPDGTLLWQKCIGGLSADWGGDLLQCTDGNIFMSSSTYSTDGPFNDNMGNTACWLVKMDSLANVIWMHVYGGTYTDYGGGSLEQEDGFITAGYTTSNDGDATGNVGANTWVIKTDTAGYIVWQHTYGGSGGDHAPYIAETYDQKIACFGYTTSEDIPGYHDGFDYYLFVLDTPCYHALYFADLDGDGYGTDSTAIVSCAILPDMVSLGGDCNDTDSLLHPGMMDLCNELDDNCNGVIDEDALFYTWHEDMDGDGYGAMEVDSISCYMIAGYTIDGSDCNDLDGAIYPGNIDSCNTVDDNCNGVIDEDALFSAYYLDADDDLFGTIYFDSVACAIPVGYSETGGDCNDGNPDIYPGATEICNYLDDDCNGFTDDGFIYIHAYLDQDGDGYGTDLDDSISCSLPLGYALNDEDCNDDDPEIYPGATEILNGLDDDCDGIADDGLAVTDQIRLHYSVYPNPASSFVFVGCSGGHPEEHDILIYNAFGQELRKFRMTGDKTRLPISDLPVGMYHVIIPDASGVFVTEFIKQQ